MRHTTLGSSAICVFLVGLALVGAVPHPVAAQDSLGVVATGSFYDNWYCYGDMAVFDSLVYVPTGQKIRVLNMADPANPVEIMQDNTTIQFTCHFVFLQDTLAICYNQNDMYITVLDVTDPQNPELVSVSESIAPLNWPKRIRVQNGLFHIVDRSTHLKIISLEDLEDIEVVFDTTFGGHSSMDIDVYDDYAYICRYDDDMLIYDISDPANPEQVGSYPVDPGAYYTHVEVIENLALFKHGHFVDVLDLSASPDDPLLHATFPGDPPGAQGYGDFSDVLLSEGQLYITSEGFGLGVLDFEDIGNPGEVVWFDTLQGTQLAALPENDCIIHSSDYSDIFAVYDVSEIGDDDIEVLFHQDPTWALDVALDWPYVFVLSGDGIHIHNVTNLDSIVEVSYYEADVSRDYLHYEDGFLFFKVHGSSMMQMVDVQDPEHPEYLWEFPNSGSSCYESCFRVRDNQLATISPEDELILYDIRYIRNPGGVQEVLRSDPLPIQSPGMLRWLDASTLLLARNTIGGGFLTLRLNPPEYTISAVVTDLQPMAHIEAGYYEDKILYLFTLYRQLAMYDLSDPAEPAFIGYISHAEAMPNYPFRVFKKGPYFVCSSANWNTHGYGHQYICRVEETAPDSFTFVVADQFYQRGRLTLTDDGMAIANPHTAYVYQFDQEVGQADPGQTAPVPSDCAITGCYPNPFNSTTRISFDLPQAGVATLAVFDLLGRQVALLHEGHLAAGSHNTVFEGADLASGVYFVRLHTQEHVATERLVLMK